MRAVNVVVVGVTGTIASGKTSRCTHLCAVANRYATAATTTAHTVRVHSINADRVGHDVYAPGKPCYYDVLKQFGTQILAHAQEATAATSSSSTTATTAEPPIDRRALGAIVFASPEKLKQLSAICWPYIEAAVRDELNAVTQQMQQQQHTSDNKAHATSVLLVLLEAAVLTQSGGLLQLCSEVWLTHCRRDVAVARVAARDGLSAADAARRVDSQDDVHAQLARLRARHDIFDGTVRTFDTSDVSLSEGLQHVDDAFVQLWRDKVQPHLSPPA